MNQRALSDVTQLYLSEYQKILDAMIDRMSSVEPTYSISHNFILQMIPHHMAAIYMSENLLKYTTSIPLQNVAKNIIAEQTKGISDMEKILIGCGEKENTERQVREYQAAFSDIAEKMFYDMENAQQYNDINIDFILEMIPHHDGAIRMSRNALNFPLCEELVPILNEIIATQTQGIRTMRRLLHIV